MLIAALVAAFVLGSCAGSFLGVVVHRMPRGLSIVRPRSRCGTCGTALSGRENLPILGWLLLRGRCRHCGTPIPASCLAMELSVAAITTLVAWAAISAESLHSRWIYAATVTNADPGPAFWLPQLAALAVLLLLVWLLIAEVLIDWQHLMLPDELTKGLQAVAIPLAALTATNGIWPYAPVIENALGVSSRFSLDPHYWFRSWDILNGWTGTPGKAAWILGLVTAASLGLIALSLPLARRIYGRLKERWEERDHRAMALGAWWFIGCTAVWTTATIVFIASQPATAFTNDWHPAPLLAFALTQAILGSLVGWWLPWMVGLVGTVAFKRNAMGYGDVKLFCGLGAFLGPVGTLVAFMLATIVGTLIGIPARLLGGGREMPFGPSLAIGAVLAVALGPWLAPLALGGLLR